MRLTFSVLFVLQAMIAVVQEWERDYHSLMEEHPPLLLAQFPGQSLLELARILDV